MTDTILAFHESRAPRLSSERRRTLAQDGVSWLLVLLVHVFFLTILIVSLRQERERIGQHGAVETILDFSTLHNTNAPPVNLIKPEVKTNAPPDITTAPITITPPKPLPNLSPNAPAAPGDVLNAIGQALACGSGNFENLNHAEQERCRHQPWLARRLPDGTIVLDAAPRAAQPELHMSGADEMRHEMQTAPPCPIILNTPCLDDMFSGRNSRAP